MVESNTLPQEWIHILTSENPPLSLEYLIQEATIEDVYDALELIEIRKYLRLEAEKFENGDKGGGGKAIC